MKTKTGLVYATEKTVHGTRISVKIRLDDECNNKHCDFAITCTIYERTRGGRWECVGGGADDDAILKYYPEFADFVALHLCDVHGAPSYAVGNGLYFLREKGPAAAANYLRISLDEAGALLASDPDFSLYTLQRAGVLDRWQREADAAIAHLESLTGETFENPYTPETERRQCAPLSGEDFARIESLCAAGYYTPEAIQERETARIDAERQKARAELAARFDRDIEKATRQKAVYLAVFDILGTRENIIFYDHSNTVVFNWESYGSSRKTWTAAEFENFKTAAAGVDVLAGLTFELK